MKSLQTQVALGLSVLCLTPSIAFAGGGEASWSTTLYHAINFALYVGLIVYMGGGAIKRSFAARSENLSAEIAAAESLQQAAEEKLNELQAKLDAFDEERVELLERYRTQGEAERDQLIAEGAREVERIRAEAERQSAAAFKAAQAEIERDLIEGALARATELLESETSAADQGRLGGEFVNEIKRQRAEG